jgi:magnesium-transporting ATPase (P-type)
MLASIYLYNFSLIFLIVSLPYVIKPGIAILDHHTFNRKVIKKLFLGMIFISLAFDYFQLALNGISLENLQFPLNLVRLILLNKSKDFESFQFVLIAMIVTALVSIIFIGFSIFKMNRKVSFQTAMYLSLFFIFIYIFFIDNHSLKEFGL